MHLADFYPRFLLQSPKPHSLMVRKFAQSAAVLIILREGPLGLEVLLTQRALHLRHHPGQISFPGGRLEKGETSCMAALRETEEEIGLNAASLQVIGQLPSYVTGTGFFMTPHLALLRQGASTALTLQTNEVESAFWLPLQSLSQAAHWYSEEVQLKGQKHQIYFYPFQNKLLWGATAAVLVNLLEQLSAN